MVGKKRKESNNQEPYRQTLFGKTTESLQSGERGDDLGENSLGAQERKETKTVHLKARKKRRRGKENHRGKKGTRGRDWVKNLLKVGKTWEEAQEKGKRSVRLVM